MPALAGRPVRAVPPALANLLPDPRCGGRLVPQPLGCLRCGPALGSVPLNSYRYSPFVSTLQARVLTRYLRVMFASHSGNLRASAHQTGPGRPRESTSRAALHSPINQGIGNRKGPNARIQPARPELPRGTTSKAIAAQHNRPTLQRPQQLQTAYPVEQSRRDPASQSASSPRLHLSLRLLSAVARTIRLVPFPFPLGLRPSHPQSRKRKDFPPALAAAELPIRGAF